ncbi:MAG: hypothetical protein ACXWKC_09760 [Xanthobacteraceae bacterium]
MRVLAKLPIVCAALFLFASNSKAATYTFQFDSEADPIHDYAIQGTLSTGDVLNSQGGYDITGITGTIAYYGTAVLDHYNSTIVALIPRRKRHRSASPTTTFFISPLRPVFIWMGWGWASLTVSDSTTEFSVVTRRTACSQIQCRLIFFQLISLRVTSPFKERHPSQVPFLCLLPVSARSVLWHGEGNANQQSAAAIKEAPLRSKTAKHSHDAARSRLRFAR